jgi:hypothetical protein
MRRLKTTTFVKYRSHSVTPHDRSISLRNLIRLEPMLERRNNAGRRLNTAEKWVFLEQREAGDDVKTAVQKVMSG